MRTTKKSVGHNQQKNNFAYAAHFFVHFSVVVLHDYNVKLPSYMFYQGGNLSCVLPCLHFSLPLIFTLVATSISHFLTAAINFSRFSSNKIHLPCFFLSLTLHPSLHEGVEIHMDVSVGDFLRTTISCMRRINMIKFCFPWCSTININIISTTFIYWRHRPA